MLREIYVKVVQEEMRMGAGKEFGEMPSVHIGELTWVIRGVSFYF
jgi:hypothetical protein